MARVTCPHCRRPTAWHGNPHRPFCSLTCRLIDLGVWLDERYRLPAGRFDDDAPTAEDSRRATEDDRVP